MRKFEMRRVLFCLLVPVALLAFTAAAYNQTCLDPDSVTLERFAPATTVYYSFNGITDDVEKNQIISALQIWDNYTNSTSGCGRIHFVAGAYTGTFPPGIAYLIFQNGDVSNSGAAHTDPTVASGLTLKLGTITINDQLTLIDGNGVHVRYFNPDVDGYTSIFKKTALHEIGHSLGLSHYTTGHPDSCHQQSAQSSVMNDGCGINDNGTYFGTTFFGPNEPEVLKSCDTARILDIYPCPTPTPTPLPPTVGYCHGDRYPDGTCATGFVYNGSYCDRSLAFQSRCDGSGYDSDTCECPDGTTTSPILVDIDGSGFALTDVANGVNFDMLANGSPVNIAWTTPGSTNAFLVLDRNGNGSIDNGEELFGNITPQPLILHLNGFNALSVYDDVDQGGDGDGAISSSDAIFSHLRLWQDLNHNGVSEPSELHTLSDFGITQISLRYRVSKRTDEFGNQFYFRSKISNVGNDELSRWAWDVILLSQQ